MKVTKEFLTKLFPLFKVCESPWSKTIWEVSPKPNVSFSVRKEIESEEVLNKVLENIAKEHEEFEITFNLMNKFPHLYLSFDKDRQEISAWVLRNGRDGEALPTIKKEDNYLNTLTKLDEMAKNAIDSDSFICSNCNTIQSKEKLAGKVFAGLYCKHCAEVSKEVKRVLKTDIF
jgi:hypothetical protein